MKSTHCPTELTYILRIWSEGQPPRHEWRMLLDPIMPESERKGFTSLEDTFIFLNDQLQLAISASLAPEDGSRQPPKTNFWVDV